MLCAREGSEGGSRAAVKDVHDCAESKRLGAARSRRDSAFYAAFVSSLFSLSLSLSPSLVCLCVMCVRWTVPLPFAASCSLVFLTQLDSRLIVWLRVCGRLVRAQ